MSRPSLSKVKDWLNAGGLSGGDSELLEDHLEDTTDPHEVTKAQVGLGNVENVKLSIWEGSSALRIPWDQVTGKPDVRVADYAAIRIDENGTESEIIVQDLYHQVEFFNENGPAQVSESDAANNRILFGDSRVYLVQFTVAGEVTGLASQFEFELMAIHAESVAVTDITGATPGVVTAAGHGLSDGDEVKVSGVGGMTEANGKVFKVANATPTTFELTNDEDDDVATGGWGAYTGGGIVQEVHNVGCEIYREFPNGQTGVAGSSFLYDAPEGDALELYARNHDNTNDITVREATVLVHGL